MARHINKRSFYYGAALYSFLQHNNNTNISIVETDEHYAVLKFQTNSSNFVVYMKYTAAPRSNANNSNVWSVSFTESDRINLNRIFSENEKAYIFVVLGYSDILGADILVLNRYNYSLIENKSTVTIKLKKNAHCFDVWWNANSKSTMHINKNLVETLESATNTEINAGNDIIEVTADEKNESSKIAWFDYRIKGKRKHSIIHRQTSIFDK